MIGYVSIGIIVFWAILTVWVQFSGIQKIVLTGNENASKKALLVYNPDPIYNLDEQICNHFADGLKEHGFFSTISTVKIAPRGNEKYDLLVFCANTYNWAPDKLIKNFISDHPDLNDKNVVAITLGSGSTKRSKRLLEELITSKGALMFASETYWLLRPNDENRKSEKNVTVALDMAKSLGDSIGKLM